LEEPRAFTPTEELEWTESTKSHGAPRARTRGTQLEPTRPGPSRDVVVVLGCRVEETGRMSAALERRATWAHAALRCGLAASVITSGGRRWGEHVEADVLARAFTSWGVPDAHVFPELSSLTTAENALFSAALLRRIGAERAIVVTCEWHMPRALACFRAAGVPALALPAPAPPSSLLNRARRTLHEVLSGRLDRYNLARVATIRARGVPHPFDTSP
jgi:uncharacterized SAM-binding protein YcdF (DUF218 family)